MKNQINAVCAAILHSSLFILHSSFFILSTCRSNPVKYATANSEECYTCGTDGKSHLTAAITLKCRQRIIAWFDRHCLYNQAVVIETHHCVDECYEHYEVGKERSLLGSCHEHEELREHTRERRNTCQ